MQAFEQGLAVVIERFDGNIQTIADQSGTGIDQQQALCAGFGVNFGRLKQQTVIVRGGQLGKQRQRVGNVLGCDADRVKLVRGQFCHFCSPGIPAVREG